MASSDDVAAGYRRNTKNSRDNVISQNKETSKSVSVSSTLIQRLGSANIMGVLRQHVDTLLVLPESTSSNHLSFFISIY